MDAETGGGRPGALAPLANPTFRTFWLASLASNFGGLVQAVGAAWTMTTLAASADMVALVQASTTLPIMLFSLASGAIADNFNRRRVMIAAQVGMFVVSAALAVCAWADLLTPWLLLGFTFAIGCGVALNNPSWQASVGDIVERGHLPAAVALNSVGFNLTRSVGPAIGGAIVAAAGAAAAFAVNAASYLAIIAALVAWKPKLPESPLPPEGLRQAMGAGLRYVAMSPHIGVVLMRSFLFGLTSVAVLALLPLVARNFAGRGALTYGLLLGAFGVGAIGGAFLGARLRASLSSEWIVRIAFAAFAACAVATALSPLEWATAAGLALGGAAWVLALSLFNVTIQLSTPRWVVGRGLALYQTAVFGGMALCDRQGGHIAVDLFERKMPDWMIRLTDLLGAIAGALIFAGIAWQMWKSAAISQMLNLATNIIYLPKAWFQYYIVVCCIITAVGMLLRVVSLLSGGPIRRSEGHQS